MSDLSELFWNASVEEIKRGYVWESDVQEFVCLLCGKRYAKGIIYPDGERLLEAEKAMSVHIETEHSSVFEYLLGLHKKITGLTDTQRMLLHYFYQGYSDSEIVAELDGGSTSTIRHHRFTLREKEKQAKVFLAIMGLLEGRDTKKPRFISVPKTTTVPDERFFITEEENRKILAQYFPEGLDGPLTEFPRKEKRKAAILKHISHRFEAHRSYTEKEVNEVLKPVYHDYVTLRRYLIEYGFLDREADGSRYWVKA